MSHCLVIELHTIDLNNANLDDDNFDDEDPENFIRVSLTAWCNRYKQRETCKKDISEKLISIAWHPTKCWDWGMSEDKERNSAIFDWWKIV